MSQRSSGIILRSSRCIATMKILKKYEMKKNIFFRSKNDVTSPYYLSVSPAVTRLTVYRRMQVRMEVQLVGSQGGYGPTVYRGLQLAPGTTTDLFANFG